MQNSKLETRNSKLPLGQPTRGKTARNRLRRVDNFLLLYAPDVLQMAAEKVFFVDVGYGAEPFTLLESGARFRVLNPRLAVLGVEIDAERVTAALPFADDQTQFRLGGFNLPLLPGESCCLIRAFNVLRQYEESAVLPAHTLLGGYLSPGGLLIEGTSDPLGRLWVANLLRKGESDLQTEGLLFSTNFRLPFSPEQFQPVLPKNYIHRMVAGEPVDNFFTAWKIAFRQNLTYRVWGERELFRQTAVQLSQQYPIDTRRKLLDKGYLLWRL